MPAAQAPAAKTMTQTQAIIASNLTQESISNSTCDYYLTRWHWFAFMSCFVFLRFQSLYYKDYGLSEDEIGTVYMFGDLIAEPAAFALSFAVDRATFGYGPRARLGGIVFCMLLNAMGFSLQAVPWPFVSTFGQMIVCRALISSAFSSAYSILNAVSSETAGDRIGEERKYGSVGFAISASILGVLQDHFGVRVLNLIVPVSTACLIAVLACSASPPLSSVEVEGNHPRRSVCTTLRYYGSTFQNLVFFLVAGATVGSLSVCGNMAFLYLSKLLMSYTLLGVAVIAQVIFEIPLLSYSKSLLSKFGARNMLAIAGLAAMLRMACYTVVPTGPWVLLVETLNGVTFAFYMPAATELMKEITPTHLQATGQTFLTDFTSL